MPGKLYYNDLVLSKAYSEGFRRVPATNPHPAGSPAALAYTEGAKKVCATFAGPAECGRRPAGAFAAVPLAGDGGTVIPTPAPAPIPAPPADLPTEDWVKADIVQWLLDHGATESQAHLNGLLKADLLERVAHTGDSSHV